MPKIAVFEAYRILNPHGQLILGFIDKNSFLGKAYQNSSSPFCQAATFYSFEDLIPPLETSGFSNFICVQTLFHELDEITKIEPILEGHGKGSFLVICVAKNIP